MSERPDDLLSVVASVGGYIDDAVPERLVLLGEAGLGRVRGVALRRCSPEQVG